MIARPKHQRLVLVILAILAVLGAVLLAMWGLQDRAAYFYTPADIAAEIIGEVQPNSSETDATETVVTPSGEVAPAVVVQDEPVAPEVVPLPEPVQPEPVANIVVDPETQAGESNPAVNTLPGETARVSAEVEPASTSGGSRVG